jgi:hypothetical protein
MINPWIIQVRNYRMVHPNITWHDALIAAKSSYQTGGAMSAEAVWARYGAQLKDKLVTDRTYGSPHVDGIP